MPKTFTCLRIKDTDEDAKTLIENGLNSEPMCNLNTIDNQVILSVNEKYKVDYKEKRISMVAPKQYNLNLIFQNKSTQKEVFDNLISNDIQSFIDGRNHLIFNTGPSNSGKV